MPGRDRASDGLPAVVSSQPQQSLLAWYAYLTDLVARRSGGSGEDLASVLVRSSEAGEGLSDLEVVGTIGLLIGAGHDTTWMSYGFLGSVPSSSLQTIVDVEDIAQCEYSALQSFYPLS